MKDFVEESLEAYKLWEWMKARHLMFRTIRQIIENLHQFIVINSILFNIAHASSLSSIPSLFNIAHEFIVIHSILNQYLSSLSSTQSLSSTPSLSNISVHCHQFYLSSLLFIPSSSVIIQYFSSFSNISQFIVINSIFVQSVS